MSYLMNLSILDRLKTAFLTLFLPIIFLAILSIVFSYDPNETKAAEATHNYFWLYFLVGVIYLLHAASAIIFISLKDDTSNGLTFSKAFYQPTKLTGVFLAFSAAISARFTELIVFLVPIILIGDIGISILDNYLYVNKQEKSENKDEKIL